MKGCWGIFREQPHSPDRVGDDERILRCVAERLRAKGLEVVLFAPEGLAEVKTRGPALVFYMCETGPALQRLAAWEAAGAPLVNPVRGVVNTFRHNMTRILAGRACSPPSLLVSTADHDPKVERGWVKRGDYHATTRKDVRFAADRAGLAAALAALRARGIASAVIQEHVEGDLLKFYGVRDAASGRPRWFCHFYHADQELRHHAFDPARLRAACEEGAALLGLEVYGGDAIVDAEGGVHVIDFNAWPSFALYRDEAADQITSLLLDKLSALPRQTSAPSRRAGAG